MNQLTGKLNIVAAIAAKDILDAFKYRLVFGLIAAIFLLGLLPGMIVWAIEPPYTDVVIYDQGNSSLVLALDEAEEFRVQQVQSIQILSAYLYNTFEPKLGLVIPAGYDQAQASGQALELQGYVTWADRSRAQSMKSEMEGNIEVLIGAPVVIQLTGKTLYPPPGDNLYAGLLALNAVTVILLMGILLVPNLIIEEKQSRTLEALLVSPASNSQVVAGKALAGSFYVLVAAIIIFGINWRAIVHWELILFFTLGAAAFSVAVGMVLGNSFERQQDTVGISMVLIVLLIGALLALKLSLDLPDFLVSLIRWVPSVPLAEIFEFVFLEHVDWAAVWWGLGMILLVSAPFYALAVWQVRRLDR